MESEQFPAWEDQSCNVECAWEALERPEPAVAHPMRKVDITCLQESQWKIKADGDMSGGGGGQLHNQDDQLAGKDWQQVKDLQRGFLIEYQSYSIVNVYGPTGAKARIGDEEEAATFYQELQNEVTKQKRQAAIVTVAGDLDPVIGEREKFMGKYKKGKRTIHGNYLRKYLTESGMFLADRAFKRRAHHSATWHSRHKNSVRGVEADVHNQIDYISVQKQHRLMLCNARLYRI